MYQDVVKNYFGIYALIGKKTSKEKFAGALYTMSLEMFLPNGKAIQGPDSHHDGQNFAKAYNIKFIDSDEKEKYVWQNTWAITTRMIGVLIGVHGDDKGLVLPPKLAENKLVIVPILFKKDRAKVMERVLKVNSLLGKFNPILDDRDGYSSGWKYNEWELKGIPIRIEIGPNDIKKKQVVLVRRDNGKKEFVKETQLVKKVGEVLEDIQNKLYSKSKSFTLKSIVKCKSINEIKKAVSDKKMCLVEMCGSIKCEKNLKDKTNGVKTLNIPFKQSKKLGKCVVCGKKADYEVRVGKSY